MNTSSLQGGSSHVRVEDSAIDGVDASFGAFEWGADGAQARKTGMIAALPLSGMCRRDPMYPHQTLSRASQARRLGAALAGLVFAAAVSAHDVAPVTTASGLVFKSLKHGSGAKPSATDVVKVHYRGTLTNGTEFDSSYKRGSPAEFPLNRVIKCWTEGVQMMQVGEKAQLTCPPAIAYGERGTPGGPIPPNATLNFEVELLGIAGK